MAAAPLDASPSIQEDFRAIAQYGFNTVRLHTLPSSGLLDDAARNGLHIFSTIQWWQQSALLEDSRSRRAIRRSVAESVRAIGGHPASLLVAIGSEIAPPVVRWLGPKRLEHFLRELYDDTKSASPDSLLTYANYPPTEPLSLPFFDVCAFNVHLDREDELRAYLARLQHVAGHRPLLLADTGGDGQCKSEEKQAVQVAMQLRTAFSEGACGAITLRWNDDEDKDRTLGLVDACGRPKLALHAAAHVFLDCPFRDEQRTTWPKVSVVVCAYDAAKTIEDCLTWLEQLTYPSFEILVVNDGSRDATSAIARRHPSVKVIDVQNAGLSAARNVGLAHASGDIVAYTDADARADPDWLTYLVQPFLTSDVVGSGGPNLVPSDDPWMAQCVARSPGGPTHVMLDDRIAEHVPGCNMAFRRDALVSIGGFSPIYRRAGDDVDICWRLQARDQRIGFAPAALVWHHHRSTVRAYWRQQVGYGESETWLMADHPEKFPGGRTRWQGRIYSSLPFVRSISGTRVHSGVWGTAEFPSIYRTDAHPASFLPHLARWQIVSLAFLVMSLTASRLAYVATAWLCAGVGLLGLSATATKCFVFAFLSDIDALQSIGRSRPSISRAIYRLTIAWLHSVQPLARAWGRVRGMLSSPHSAVRRASPIADLQGTGFDRQTWTASRLLAGRSVQHEYWSERQVGRAHLLARLTAHLRASRVAQAINIDEGWGSHHDISVRAGRWVSFGIRALVEDQESGHRLCRVAIRLRIATVARVVAGAAILLPLGLVALAMPKAAVSTILIASTLITWSAYRIGQTVANIQHVIGRVATEVGLSPCGDADHLAEAREAPARLAAATILVESSAKSGRRAGPPSIAPSANWTREAQPSASSGRSSSARSEAATGR